MLTKTKDHSKLDNPTEQLICSHCDLSIEPGLEISQGSEIFCCSGCKTVYSILASNGLKKYYQIQQQEGVSAKTSLSSNEDYLYLDHDDFAQEFIIKQEGSHLVKFYIEGVHCLACLWLIEKMPSLLAGLLEARLNLEDSTATFTIKDDLKLSSLAKTIASLGYKPHPLKFNESAQTHQIREDRKEMMKIGVAASAMGNIMLYAISNYAGADGNYRIIFNWISFFIAIPVVCYSALPFYKTSLQAIKLKESSIDIPLTIAIVLGFVFSTYSLFIGGDDLYFDSISTLIFLILISRYFVKKMTRSGLDTKGIQTLFSNTGVKRINKIGEIENIHSKFVERDDSIIVGPGEKFIFDVTTTSSTTVDSSIITGESKPQKVQEGETIFAGSINLATQVTARVQEVGNQTRIGKILKKIEASSSAKSQTVQRADEIAKYFIVLVLALTTGAFIYYYLNHSTAIAIQRALAIVIISCPCALALATPLSFIKVMNRLKMNGIYVKNENILEKVNKLENIVLDKTGTLTKGKFELIKFLNYSKYSDRELHILSNSLEASSIHPIAISLKKFFQSKSIDEIELNQIQNITGMGVVGYVEQECYSIGKIKESSLVDEFKKETQVGLYKDSELLAIYILGDQLVDDVKKEISQIKELNKNLYLASGDHTQVVEDLAKELNIDNFYSKQSPEQKSQLVKEISHCMMVGDGANDALALKTADVAIAVGGAVDLSLRASDVFVENPGIKSIKTLIICAKETQKVLKRNFRFSLSYNIIGVTLALFGYVTPLWAAIFMPISSLTVLVSSFYGTKELNDLFKEQI